MQGSRYVQQSNLDRLETESQVSEPKHVTSGNKSTIGRLFVLDLSSGEIFSTNADGSDKKVIVSGCRHPDGIAGFDEVAGAVTGIFALEGTSNNPRLPPIHVVCDYIVAWLTTVGIISALRRRAVDGGSYLVVVSLTRVTLWLLSLGIFDRKYAQTTARSSDEHTYVAPDLFTADAPLGLYQGVTEQVVMSRTPGSFRTVLVPRGSSKPE